MIKSKKSTKSLHPSTYYGDRAAGRERGGLKTVFLADTMEIELPLEHTAVVIADTMKKERHVEREVIKTVVLEMLWSRTTFEQKGSIRT